MEVRGHPINWESGASIAKLMGAGFSLTFEVQPADPPIVDQESGTIFLTICKLLAIPLRRPASKIKSPAGAEVHANAPLEMFKAELDNGKTELRDIYAEKCATELVAMLKRQAPWALR